MPTAKVLCSDFRPIANIRLFYKVFAYRLLARIESIVELEQAVKQHGFRPGRRIEEHLLTTNIFFNKATAAGRTSWIKNLDLWAVASTVGSST